MGEVVELIDKPFRAGNYAGVTDFDLVKVTLTSAYTGKVRHAVNLLGADFTGVIRRLEIDTWIAHGLQIGATCHDVQILGGYIHLRGKRDPAQHDECVQVVGGYRVNVSDMLLVNSAGGGQNYGIMIEAGSSPPDVEDVVFDGCFIDAMRGTILHAVRIQGSLRSGVRNSYVMEGQDPATTISVGPTAIEPVNSGNVIIPAGVPIPEVVPTWQS